MAAFSAAATIGSMDPLNVFADLHNPPPVYFDFHSHVGWSFLDGQWVVNTEALLAQTIGEMKQGSMTGVFLALVADAPLLKVGAKGISFTGKYANDEGWLEYKRQLALLQDLFIKSSLHFSTKSRELQSSNKQLAVYLAVEGGDFLGGKIENADLAYQDGVRSIQLVHYAPNDLGDNQTSENNFNGLSSFGKELVPRMNKLGMVIDVAHATYQTTREIVALSKAPVILSHSILEMEADRPIGKRAISKDHAKMVAGTGGVIGAWPSGFNKSFDEYVDNIKRLVDVVGIDHVGVGTDMNANFRPVLTNYTEYPQLAKALQSKGFSSNEVGKLMGENAKRILLDVLKKN